MKKNNYYWDFILVGAGLWNSIIAWYLRQYKPKLNILLIELNSSISKDHIWSFHQHDISSSQHIFIKPLITYSWPSYQVKFPKFNRQIFSGYYSICSKHLNSCLKQNLGNNNFLFNNKTIEIITPTSICLNNREIINANCIIDGRGLKDFQFKGVYQIFLGQQWYLSSPHGLNIPIIMDATINQKKDEYRFIYTLPLTPNSLMIEDTRYTKKSFLTPDMLKNSIHYIQEYAFKNKWKLVKIEREEVGCIPIPFKNKKIIKFKKIVCVGLRANLFHVTTGYSLPIAIQLAENIAKYSTTTTQINFIFLLKLVKKFIIKHQKKQRFFYLLNRLFFLSNPRSHLDIMQYFYSLPEKTISNFYANKLSLFDKIRIFSGKPPISLFQALHTIFFKFIK
ncbi:lycopene cyclase (plasmid) [Candidatus Profftella armatura (Diaphorina cf. continua)]|uniref:Lycopene cyclase n=1 Tax=Candidatus Profftella armatura (Diaphorina cf. continua) TaxID=2661583 RepID=A0A7R6W0B0_9PROT|nr:lycopene beta-cyclase CrtY [Candidatus Profftella armatura (Diaphorina cf. continua)]BCG49783.1 lycopene cyclase [Candidatus Profftella armatura (Diaphorina cf. continua)]